MNAQAGWECSWCFFMNSKSGLCTKCGRTFDTSGAEGEQIESPPLDAPGRLDQFAYPVPGSIKPVREEDFEAQSHLKTALSRFSRLAVEDDVISTFSYKQFSDALRLILPMCQAETEFCLREYLRTFGYFEWSKGENQIERHFIVLRGGSVTLDPDYLKMLEQHWQPSIRRERGLLTREGLNSTQEAINNEWEDYIGQSATRSTAYNIRHIDSELAFASNLQDRINEQRRFAAERPSLVVEYTSATTLPPVFTLISAGLLVLRFPEGVFLREPAFHFHVGDGNSGIVQDAFKGRGWFTHSVHNGASYTSIPVSERHEIVFVLPPAQSSHSAHDFSDGLLQHIFTPDHAQLQFMDITIPDISSESNVPLEVLLGDNVLGSLASNGENAHLAINSFAANRQYGHTPMMRLSQALGVRLETGQGTIVEDPSVEDASMDQSLPDEPEVSLIFNRLFFFAVIEAVSKMPVLIGHHFYPYRKSFGR